MKQFGPTKVLLSDSLTVKNKIRSEFGDSTILIYDKIFDKNRKLSKWTKNFSRRYAVRSGEKLKNVDGIAVHLKKLVDLSKGLAPMHLTIVVMGGGTVGDFGAFVASVLKRGVRLIHIPSTWLAAIDSAHGGKTALNVGRVKNQIGTFYPAERVYLFKELLLTQPEDRALEALGEVFKIGLIGGGPLWRKLQKMRDLRPEIFWQLLLPMVRAKYVVVKKDPFEKRGIRYVLNLGHTIGHVFESRLRLPHGIAVLYGLHFAVEWSYQRQYLSSKKYYDIRMSGIGSYLPDHFEFRKLAVRTSQVDKLLLQDKKISSGQRLNFVFIDGAGQPRIEKVKVEEILKEFVRQIK